MTGENADSQGNMPKDGTKPKVHPGDKVTVDQKAMGDHHSKAKYVFHNTNLNQRQFL